MRTLTGMLAVAIAALALGCGDGRSPVAPATPLPLIAPTSLSPNEGETIHHNDPTIGCAPDPMRGSGFAIDFAWAPVTTQPGVEYDVFCQRQGSPYPMIDRTVSGSTFRFVSCNGYVADGNLDDWRWRVRARRDAETGPWSEERSFRFAHCTVHNQACMALP
jgi:hypothetical protein